MVVAPNETEIRAGGRGLYRRRREGAPDQREGGGGGGAEGNKLELIEKYEK